MKIISFEAAGRQSYGVTDGTGIVDVGRRLGKEYPDVRTVLEHDALDAMRRAAEGAAADHLVDEVTVLQPITNPNMIICVGMNYGSAFAEINGKFPGYPSLFMRRTSAQAGHNQPIVKPKETEQFDCEVELAVIIGRKGRHIAQKDALSHIAGYAVFNDASACEWMHHTNLNVTPGKNFDSSGAFGPWMVTADEIPDPARLRLVHRLNGEILQEGPVDDMCYKIPQIIEYISTFTTLLPGDVISTGSPGGIRARRKAGIYVVPGDVIEMEISGIGMLRNPVV